MASLFFIFTVLLSASTASTLPKYQPIESSRLLDLLVRDYTFKFFKKRSIKTGIVHAVRLPSNLSGITVDTVRFRCGSLHRYGAHVKEFHVGVGAIVKPCAERVVLVKQNLGINWSSIYYTNYDLSGYQLVSPVLGLLAYNANGNANFSNPCEVSLVAAKNPISVDFRNITSLDKKTLLNRPMCASFGDNGNVTLKNEVLPFVCVARNNGHFGLVIQSTVQGPVNEKRKIKRWKVVIGSFVGCVIGVFLLGLLLVAIFVKVKKEKKAKREEMERRAYAEEALQVSMVGHIRALTAAATRTLPESIEHECIPN